MVKILGRKTSSNVQKVLWFADEIGIAYEREDYGGPFGRNKEPEYLALNPNGLVPTLIDGDLVLWESNAIVRYLGARYDTAGTLYPKDPAARAAADKWMDWQQTVVAPAITPVFLGLIRTKPENRDMAAIGAARDRFAQALAILDAQLAKTAYVAGPNLTIGDIPLGIMVYRWFVMDIKREELPNLKRWHDLLAKRPPFRQHVMLPLA